MNRRAHRFRRQTSAAVSLLTIALLAGCGSESTDQKSASEASPTTQSTQSASASPTESESPAATSAPVPTPAPAVEFDTTMVRSVEVNKVNKVNKGGQANVFVVAGLTDPDDLLEVANGCVKHYLREQKAAFCHVWGTEANFAARDPQGVGDLLCWTHYVGVRWLAGTRW